MGAQTPRQACAFIQASPDDRRSRFGLQVLYILGTSTYARRVVDPGEYPRTSPFATGTCNFFVVHTRVQGDTRTRGSA